MVRTVMSTAPTLDLSGNRVSESAANGTVVGKAVATEVDTSDTLTYSLVNDADGRFAIDSNTGTITVANSSLLDFETATSHTVRVRVVDAGGLSSEQDIAITVANANEAPTASDNTVSLDEDGSHRPLRPMSSDSVMWMPVTACHLSRLPSCQVPVA